MSSYTIAILCNQGILNLADCCIRVTVLFEYLGIVLAMLLSKMKGWKKGASIVSAVCFGHSCIANSKSKSRHTSVCCAAQQAGTPHPWVYWQEEQPY